MHHGFFGKSNWTLAAVMVVFSIVSVHTIPSSTGKVMILEQANKKKN